MAPITGAIFLTSNRATNSKTAANGLMNRIAAGDYRVSPTKQLEEKIKKRLAPRR
jgi:hypothetical protein